MATFDFHFHLLFKHYFTTNKNITTEVKTKGTSGFIDDLFGGPFDSQAAPVQIGKSELMLGVANILSMEHAFALRILKLPGLDLTNLLNIDKELIRRTRDGETSYYEEYVKQVDYHLDTETTLEDNYRITFLNRKDWNLSFADTRQKLIDLGNQGIRSFAFAMEGGHNLSKEKIHQGIDSLTPELSLQELQDGADDHIDLMLLNLCHLSYIPEQKLGGFAQGLNNFSQLLFHSEDFMPTIGTGLTELGKKVVRQALTHPKRPVLIDVKHMSVYTRFQYYRFREKLIQEEAGRLVPDDDGMMMVEENGVKRLPVKKLPVITSHTGFTFCTLKSFLENKKYTVFTETKHGRKITGIVPENIRIAKMDYLVNRGLYCNPWTINLFDEEIVEIMRSGGLMGISLDQRLMGASNPGADSLRDKYFQQECIAEPEWKRMFKEGRMPEEKIEGIAPGKEARHSMLFCLHLVHAVRVGYANLTWATGKSPWDCVCIGSDFDGLVNPINGIQDVTRFNVLRQQILDDLPEADRILDTYTNVKALRYNNDGTVDTAFLRKVVDKFMYENGVDFIARFLTNWR